MHKDNAEEESPLRFPCSFPIKAVGLAESDFAALVVGIVRQHAKDLEDTSIKTRGSGGGKYLAVTCTIEARSRGQLDAIYQELTAHEQVKWAI